MTAALRSTPCAGRGGPCCQPPIEPPIEPPRARRLAAPKASGRGALRVTIGRLGAALLAGLALQAGAQPLPDAQPLERIRQRGALVVGVKTDYAPFGMLDAAGRPQGLEHDLAADLARRLGVGLRLVPVSGANRLQKLEEGSIDIVIATMGDTAERRRLATVVEPSYYASGVTLFMRPEARVSDWLEIRGQTVCATQGSYFNRAMAERYLLELLMFNNARDARLAVRDGRCIGYLFDNTAIASDLRQPQWAGYKAPLPPAMVTPWSVALARSAAGSTLERAVGDALADWHRSGFLRAREAAWGLPPSEFLLQAQQVWLRRDAAGRWVCERDARGDWPADCRHRLFVSAQDVGGLRRWGLALKDSTGWDLSYVYDAYDRGRVLGGLLQTVLLMLACVAGSMAVGVAGAWAAQSRHASIGRMVRALAVWGRMTPPLLLMYLLFFGLGSLLWEATGWSLSAWAVAVVCLSYYTGASVMTALLDACAQRREVDPAFRWDCWRTLGAVYANASGSITASLVNVCKATMMASVLAVPELLSTATSVLVDQGNVAEVMNMLLVAYVLLVALALRALERLQAWFVRRAAALERAGGPPRRPQARQAQRRGRAT